MVYDIHRKDTKCDEKITLIVFGSSGSVSWIFMDNQNINYKQETR